MAQPRTAVFAASLLAAVALASPAAAAGNIPITLKLKGCGGCTVTANWNSTGTAKGQTLTSDVEIPGKRSTATFSLPKGGYVYFTALSGDPKVAADAQTVLITRFVGKKTGDRVKKSQLRRLSKGGYFCLRAKKQTVKARAAVVADGQGGSVLGLWADPQLPATGKKLKTGFRGTYGTQNTLICKGR